MNNEVEILLKKTFNLDDDKMNCLSVYYDMLVETSKVMNLTTITEHDEAYIKHFYDSLLLSKYEDLTKNISLVDIGTGAGFPGLVLKICFPNLKVLLIEPTLKRCNFLNSVITRLKLKNITVINDRAENCIINHREKYDIATARAVAGLPMLLELCSPFVKNGGTFIALKGLSFEEEISNSINAASKLNVKLVKSFKEELPFAYGTRAIIIYKKINHTPKEYPRQYAKIKNKPL